jgi:hypothetical protein
MKKLFYSAVVLAALASCKSTKNADCDAYGQNTLQRNPKNCEIYTDCVICIDTVCLEKLHVHFYDHNTCEWSCLDMPKENVVIVDTFYFANDSFHVQN